MKVYTKTGDTGSTYLVGGARVSKSHPRVNAYGDVDELISYLGVLRCELDGTVPVREIQVALMEIAAHLANESADSKLKPFDASKIITLEEEINVMTEAIPQQKSFILPAHPLISSECHVARTICRRAERSAVAIEPKTEEDLKSIRYLNRLSDYLFTLARYLCFRAGTDEDYWRP